MQLGHQARDLSDSILSAFWYPATTHDATFSDLPTQYNPCDIQIPECLRVSVLAFLAQDFPLTYLSSQAVIYIALFLHISV